MDEQLLLNKAWQAINAKQGGDAFNYCHSLTEQYPNFAAGWHVSSYLAFMARDYDKAITDIDFALQLQPQQFVFIYAKAQMLQQLGQRKLAVHVLTTLASTDNLSLQQLSDLAFIYSSLEQHQASASCYQQALQISPKQADLHFNYGAELKFLGELKQAKKHFKIATKLNPNDSEAKLQLAQIAKATAEDNQLSQIKVALAKASTALDIAKLHYASAKELEDLEQYSASFSALQLGANAFRNSFNYDISHDLELLELIQQNYQSIEDGDSVVGEGAVFVLGLPRTGSTLVERIISNHPQVDIAGELNCFNQALVAQVKQYSEVSNQQQLIGQSSKVNFEALGQNYMARADGYRAEGQYFIDKFPLNSLYIGAIAKALPKAKIVYVARHPMDTCYAIYKQLFNQGYPFSYELTELARYMVAHHKLMQHWQQLLGDKLFTISYEQLVNEPQSQSQQMYQYLGLDFKPEYCQLSANKQASTTASAAQVRGKVYTSSVAKWRHYEGQLSEAKQIFEQAGMM
ncbi:sulfotransferase [Paraferrimonas sp. SM1919]|uniref:tetratricopeptide repeat-containing sulfotransferase family protein n=1 Tax=Paraferrimonas sp. SM1919 TaxID=2662263 RepID=UPI0013D18C59|nr:sulfotransferase [Paraferrimonas sp. SM1919]